MKARLWRVVLIEDEDEVTSVLVVARNRECGCGVIRSLTPNAANEIATSPSAFALLVHELTQELTTKERIAEWTHE